jgi:hypothetical protein
VSTLSDGTLSEWGLVIVGIGASLLAWAQLRANHNQMVMQLFEKRLEIYEKTLGCIISLMHGREVDVETLVTLSHVSIKAKFLFGDDFDDFLAHLQVTAQDLMRYDHATTLAEREEKQKVITKLALKIGELESICQKYMRMDQRLNRRLI